MAVSETVAAAARMASMSLPAHPATYRIGVSVIRCRRRRGVVGDRLGFDFCAAAVELVA